MEQVRTRNALSRIDAALARIDDLAERLPRRDAPPPSTNDRVRQEAAAALSALDDLIAELEA